MNISKFIKSSMVAVGLTAALLPGLASAQTQNPFNVAKNNVNNVTNAAGISGTPASLPDIIGRVINVLLTFLGIIFLLLVLYAGFLWMTAQGDEKQVTKAKDMIRQAIIGLVIIVAGYAISNFVLDQVVNVTKSS